MSTDPCPKCGTETEYQTDRNGKIIYGLPKYCPSCDWEESDDE